MKKTERCVCCNKKDEEEVAGGGKGEVAVQRGAEWPAFEILPRLPGAR